MRKGRSKFPEIVSASAFAAGIAGIWASIATGSWEWFSRSGSAVVALGVLLTGSEFLLYDKRVRSHFDSIGAKPHPTDDQQVKSKVLGDVDGYTTWIGEMFGFWLIFAGTIVWGFGDLIGALTH